MRGGTYRTISSGRQAACRCVGRGGLTCIGLLAGLRATGEGTGRARVARLRAAVADQGQAGRR